MVNTIVKTGADISIANYKKVTKNTFMLKPISLEMIELIDTKEAVRRVLLDQGFGAFSWAKLYPKRLIEKYPYPKGMVYEDLAVINEILGACKKIAVSNKIVYYYYMRQDSITHSLKNQKYVDDLLYARQLYINYVKKKYPDLLNLAYTRYIQAIVSSIISISYQINFKNTYKDLKTKLLNSFNNHGKKNEYINAKTKLEIFLISKSNYTFMHFISKTWFAYKRIKGIFKS